MLYLILVFNMDKKETNKLNLFINKIIEGDCLKVMPKLPDKSIDMILTDLPYGTTQNEWDSIIPLNKLTKDSIIILSIKFKKKIPDVSLNDIMTYLLGGFMSIDEVLKDESNNEIYTLLAKKADKEV